MPQLYASAATFVRNTPLGTRLGRKDSSHTAVVHYGHISCLCVCGSGSESVDRAINQIVKKKFPPPLCLSLPIPGRVVVAHCS